MVGGDIQDVVHQSQAAIDVHHALQLGTALGNRDALFPDRQAALHVHCDDLAAGQTGQRQATGDQRSASTAQGQDRHAAFVDPATVTAGGVEGDQLVVLGLHHHDVTIGRRSGKHLAGHPGAPFLLAAGFVESDHIAAQGADQHHAVADADATGNRQVEILFPQHIAAFALDRHHPAFGGSGVDHRTVHGRLQQVVEVALAITDRAAPLLLQTNLFGEVGEFRRRQFFLRVTAAAHGQQGQRQQRHVFPAQHVRHLPWPDRPA
ncbi:hypothetical protein D3C81_1047820 [compost metagenome]